MSNLLQVAKQVSGEWMLLDRITDKTYEALRQAIAQAEQFDMDDHPPHRLCECRKCMEYFTPLPDCDAFAGGGKPIAEQQEPVPLWGDDKFAPHERPLKAEQPCSDFETWWQQEGQETMYALNTLTDADAKVLAEIAWKNGAFCADKTGQQKPDCVVHNTDTPGHFAIITPSLPVGTKLYVMPPQRASVLAAEYTRGREDGYAAGMLFNKQSPVFGSYCGATLWLGQRKVTLIATEETCKNEREFGVTLFELTQQCLEKLAEDCGFSHAPVGGDLIAQYKYAGHFGD